MRVYNCLVVDDEDFSRTLITGFVEETPSLQLIAACSSAIEAQQLLQNELIDIIFLDIEMPGMTGIEFIQSMEELPQVILITGRNDFASEAYEHSVTDYLSKPVEYPRFLKAVNKAVANLGRKKESVVGAETDIFIKSDSKIIRIALKEVDLVEALADYVIIHIGEKKHIVHATMKSVESKLRPFNFLRVHRSYIVNFSRVDYLEDTTVFIGKKTAPIGASYRNALMDRLNFL